MDGAGVLRGGRRSFAALPCCDHFNDRSSVTPKHGDAFVPEKGRRSDTHSPAKHGFDSGRMEEIDGIARPVDMIVAGISDRIGGTDFGIIHEEKRCASEMFA